jgi:hypothetical protein
MSGHYASEVQVGICKSHGGMYARGMAGRPFFFVSVPLWALIIFFPFWMIFGVIYFAVWIVVQVTLAMVRYSRNQPGESDDLDAGYTPDKL